MKKKKNKLSLNKFTITKIENPNKILGGAKLSSEACNNDSSEKCNNTTGGGTASNANKTAAPPTKPPKNTPIIYPFGF